VDSHQVVVDAMNILLPAFRTALLDLQPIPTAPTNQEIYAGTYTGTNPILGEMQLKIEQSTYKGHQLLKINIGNDSGLKAVEKFLVLPADRHPGVLSIWNPPSLPCHQYNLDDTVLHERLHFTFDSEGKVVSFTLPGYFGSDFTFTKDK